MAIFFCGTEKEEKYTRFPIPAYPIPFMADIYSATIKVYTALDNH